MTATQADRAIAAGVGYLASSAGAAGWLGFPTLAGRSDEWVTAFVLAHAWRAGRARKPYLRAARALAEHSIRTVGGAYGPEVPTDADSTAWALAALGERRANLMLRQHIRPDGIATYLASSGIAEFVELAASTMTGWTSAHPDVTAAALAGALPIDADTTTLLAALVTTQSPAGWWPAYWWRGPHYTTALILRALDRFGMTLPASSATLLRAALEREQLADGGYALGAGHAGDLFTTALAAESTIRLGADARPAIAFLLDSQRPNGSWAGAAVMRIPAPPVIDPTTVAWWHEGGGGGNSFITDTEGLFATAVACHSLRLHRDHTPPAHRRPLPERPVHDDPNVALVRVS